MVENYCASVPATAGEEKMNNETTKGPSQRFLVDNASILQIQIWQI